MVAMISKTQEFKRHAKVVAAEDLPFVPAGTQGKVLYSSGFTWIRYHVAFENGEVVSSVDGVQLVTPEEWAANPTAPERTRTQIGAPS